MVAVAQASNYAIKEHAASLGFESPKLHDQREPCLLRVDAVSGGQRGQAARSRVEGLVGSRQRGRNGGCSQPGRPT